MTRFVVRASHSEYGPCIWRVWDAVDRRWLGAFSREMTAQHMAARFEQVDRRRLFGDDGIAS